MDSPESTRSGHTRFHTYYRIHSGRSMPTAEANMERSGMFVLLAVLVRAFTQIHH